MEVQFGLSKVVRNEAVEALTDFLSHTYALYLKTQNFHWNVTGPQFFSLHLLFQKQYEELAEAVDEIAERVRTLGSYIEASFSAFQKRTIIPESNRKSSAKVMLKELIL